MFTVPHTSEMNKITYTSLDNNMLDLMNKNFVSDFRNGYVKADGVVLPACCKEFEQRIRDLEVRDDDIWVCSYPKSGTTWTQEMVWCIAKELDFKAAEQSLPQRFPYLENSMIIDFKTVKQKSPNIELPPCKSESIEYINRIESPRFIKTHFPFKLLPKKLKDRSTKAKIIYVARNIKDTCLSYFHHCCFLNGYKGNFEDFCKLFASDSLIYSPFVDHLHGYWDWKDDPRVLLLKYEDMKEDLRSVIRRTAQFLGKNLTDDQIVILENHLSFKSMKSNRSLNLEPEIELYKAHKLLDADGSFIRNGVVGEGKEKMSPMYVKIFDELEEKYLRT